MPFNTFPLNLGPTELEQKLVIIELQSSTTATGFATPSKKKRT